MKKLIYLVLLFHIFIANSQERNLDSLFNKAQLIFEDDFNRLELKDSALYMGKKWRPNLSSSSIKQSGIKNNIAYLKVSADANHGASIAHYTPFDDGILQVKYKMIDKGLNKKRGFHINFNDEDATEFVHYGHVCQIAVKPNQVLLVDQFTGVHRNDIWALIKSGDKEKERMGRAMVKDKYYRYPVTLELEKWSKLTLVFIKDELSVYINNELVARKKSLGFDHNLKKELVLGLWNSAVEFDDLKVWTLDK